MVQIQAFLYLNGKQNTHQNHVFMWFFWIMKNLFLKMMGEKSIKNNLTRYINNFGRI